jgi:DNA-binding beta-propeller fold protein YncE
LVRNSQFRASLVLLLALATTLVGEYRPPAGEKPALRGENGSSILPGGRVVQPLGMQIPIGPGPVKIVASPSGRRIATANLGPERSSVTILEQDRKGEWSLRNFLTPASGGIAFQTEKSVWVSEGASGGVRLMDVETGSRKRSLELSGGYAGDLAFDPSRSLLFVVDQAHDRVVVFDTHEAHSAQSIADVGAAPNLRAIALSPDATRAYALSSSAVSVLDITDASSPKLLQRIPVADAAAILAAKDAVFVSNPVDDSIDVIDPATNLVRVTVPIRIPGLESLRGIQPRGMAYDESRRWLLVAEAGINAVGVIDMSGAIKAEVLGHLPVGWFPTSILWSKSTAMVANAKGRGTGPSSIRISPEAMEFEGVVRRGSISRFDLPAAGDLAKPTRLVMATNGLLELSDRARETVPVGHVVIILKGSRNFDDILGDIQIPGAVVAGLPQLAHLGNEGYADGRRMRFSLQQVPVTPNHHALAQQFTLSDNFYADPDGTGVGLREHLERHHISVLDLGEAFDAAVPDQARASRLIAELDEKYRKAGVPLPQVTLIHLPNDKTAPPHPQNGYPYSASYAADNDLALGRIVDYFSHSPWWREMAIFVTEAEAPDGRDHIDAHRAVFLGIGPWFRRGYCSHVNADYAAVLKWVFRQLHVPSWNLADASAADLDDMFTTEPDYAPYIVQPIDPRLFDASKSPSPSE